MPRPWTILAVAFLAACAAAKKQAPDETTPSSDVAPEPEPEPEKPVATYPAPFTADQIRAATKEGRTYRYKVEIEDKPATERVITFTKVDEGGAEIFSGGEKTKRMGWVTLQKHAEFPKDRVTTHEERIRGPAGKFDCVVYVVKGDDGEITTYFFAKTLPGAPVLYYTEKDGRRLKTTTLLQHIAGR